MKKILTIILFFCAFHPSFAQQDSCSLRISLLTCAPGAELYSIFGHTALRVQDEQAGIDAVYNYGTFEFGPDFYMKFIRGKLPYFLSVEDFNGFISSYQQESRSVWEQPLHLSCNEKEKLNTALQLNALPQNRTYKYDFLFDNCTTRAKDIVKRNAAQGVKWNTLFKKQPPSFRQLIHEKLEAGHLVWSQLGIDLLLGARLDAKATNEQAMFLPQNLMKGFDGATNGNVLLATTPQTILEMPSPLAEKTLFAPFLVFSLLSALLLFLSFVPHPIIQKAVSAFDAVFFFSAGAAGALMLFMWWGTDYALCAHNWNLCWAIPTHLLVAPFLRTNKPWLTYYLLATIVLQMLLLIGWVFLPQELNIAVLPIVLLILLRSWLIILKPHHGTTQPDLSK